MPFATGLIAILAAFLSAFIVAPLIQVSDRSSIISLRRIFALFLISTIIWLFVFTTGVAYSGMTKNPSPGINAFLFGGFLATSFELVVINGVFIKNTLRSLGLATIHPLSVFATIAPRTEATSINYAVASVTGLVMIVTALIFLHKLENFKTKNGITPLQLLRAFLKTWVIKYPQELENYFELYSRREEIQTKIFHFLHQSKKITLVLPGIHPGPFYPVGSYNLSETIFQTLKAEDSIAMVFHGTGGHERNFPRNEYTNLYATKLAEFVRSLKADQSQGFRGPVRRKLGVTNITGVALDAEVLAMISKAPYNSDDLDPEMIESALTVAGECGLNLALVDAHNSIGGQDSPSDDIKKEDWAGLFECLKSEKKQDFNVGYAHSSEISFTHNSDISEAGIGVLLLGTEKSKFALVVVDSNNAIAGLRDKISEGLGKEGIELIELCTSDTHNLAARNLISRGYFALGEATNINEIINAVTKLVEIAQRRLDTCKYTTASFSTDLPLMGIESLNDFASLTDSVIEFTKSYFKKTIPLLFIMLGITLFY